MSNGDQKNDTQMTGPKQVLTIVHDDGQFAGLMDSARFSQAWRVAQVFANSTLVPVHFQGKPENCFIGIHMAMRCGVDPLMFLQKSYVVHGRPGIESTLAIALANSSGVFSTNISYRLEGDGEQRKCTAFATMKKTGEIVEETVSVATAKKMGWWQKDGSLWPKMTDLMLKYRSAMWLIRTTAPEVILGLLSKDELLDSDVASPPRISTSKVSRSRLADALDSVDAELSQAQATGEVREAVDEPAPDPAIQREPGDEGPGDQADEQLNQFSEMLAKCTTRGEINQLESHWLGPDIQLDQEQSAIVRDACNGAREKISGPRGPASNAAKPAKLFDKAPN